VLEADPRDAATRQRLAELLRRADRVAEAVEEYGRVADQYARQGLLAKAIALCKTILELDPEHATTQAALAELYAARARAERPTRLGAMHTPAVLVPGRGDGGPALIPISSHPEDSHVELPLASARPQRLTPPPATPAPRTPTAPAPPAAETPLAQMVSVARAAAAAGVEEDVVLDLDDEPLEILETPRFRPAARGEPRGVAVPADVALPRVPLFSDLSREAFIALTEGMVLQRVGAGEVVIQEGEAGSSFFIVAGGTLVVSKRDDRGERVRLARLSEGDFFGEMAILSGSARLATVTADTDVELLEIRAEVLLDLAGRHPHVAVSLRRFYRQRLLANAMAVSPVFRPLSREARREVMARFRTREVSAGEVIIREGEPTDGLYVVLDGVLQVRHRRGAEGVEVGELRGADVFGEMSCLRKIPATATVTARRAGTLLRLPRAGFDELVLSHPQILEVVAEITEERAESLDAILSGHAQWTEEGLVLI
jgi:CRP-like cAMP-binding protein